MLMRSGAPLALGGEAVKALGALGFRTALDLREPIEHRQDPVELTPL